MTKGMSLHIGVNVVDRDHYGSDMQLSGPVPDAVAMQVLASDQGFETSIVLDAEASCGNVAEGIAAAAQKLQSGDIFMLTYAGHGSQVFDYTGDETDGLDETWCLHDRMLLDDEIYQLLGLFQSNVRVLVISDSCHSGTVARKSAAKDLLSDSPVFRGLPREAALQIEEKHRPIYKAAKFLSLRGERTHPAAAIELLAACQDNQLALDLGANGLFTQHLLALWNDGRFDGSFSNFFRALRDGMPPYQSPNRLSFGARNQKFQTGRPFEI